MCDGRLFYLQVEISDHHLKLRTSFLRKASKVLCRTENYFIRLVFPAKNLEFVQVEQGSEYIHDVLLLEKENIQVDSTHLALNSRALRLVK